MLTLFPFSIHSIVKEQYKPTLPRSLFAAEVETLTTVIWKVPEWLVSQPAGGGDDGAIALVTA